VNRIPLLRALACALLLCVVASSAAAQTLNDANIVSNNPMMWSVDPGNDPEGRLYPDFFSGNLIAFPGSQTSVARRAMFGITPQTNGLLYEFAIQSGYKAAGEFAIWAEDCQGVSKCRRIYWQDVTGADGVLKLRPAPTAEESNPPVFTAQAGDRFGIIWASGGTYGQFKFYVNRSLVLTLSNTSPGIEGGGYSQWNIVTRFFPDSQTRLLSAREIQYQ
jgi:hypothetical protein